MKFFKSKSPVLRNENLDLNLEQLENRVMLSTVEVFAAGNTGEENLDLFINGQLEATFSNVGGDVQQRDLVRFVFETDQDVTTGDVAIGFNNDAFDPATGFDRNLLVDRIVVDGVTAQTEDPSTFSTGIWRDGLTGPGFFETELFNINATFSFADQQPPPTGSADRIEFDALGTTGDEIVELVVRGEVVETFALDSAGVNETFSFTSNDSDLSIEDIRIQFVNDLFDPAAGIDRNAQIFEFRLVDSATGNIDVANTNDSNVLSDGIFIQGVGITSGLGAGGFLASNGFVEVSNPSTGGGPDIQGTNGDDVLIGGAGDEDIFGGNGNDFVNGGGGDDTINGGSGNDFFIGGGGADQFVFASGDDFDTISDFEIGTDSILFTGGLAPFNSAENGFTDIADRLVQSGDDVLILTNDNQSVRLLNTQVDDLIGSTQVNNLVDSDALEILGVADGNFNGIVQGQAVDSFNNGGDVGSVVLTIIDGVQNVQSSNFGSNSFELTNTGNKEVAAVFIDIRGAVFGDMVFDNDGTGGDTTASTFQVDRNGNTGAFFVGENNQALNAQNLFFQGQTPLADTSGLGSAISGGFRGLLIRFDGSNGGFDGGESIGFSGDGDPNSIAGFSQGEVGFGSQGSGNAITGTFDTGGQSGAELVGSSFTVLFADGTAATGFIGSDTSQAGGAGEAVQGREQRTPNVTIDTGSGVFSSTGNSNGQYGGAEPQITVTGQPGDTVRVTLYKGVNPVVTSAGSPDSVADVIQNRLDATQSQFPVNNAFDVQNVDVVIGANGTAQIASGAFDYNNTNSGLSFAGDEVQPLAITAAIVVAATDGGAIAGGATASLVPLGSVSTPVYLLNPTATPVA